MPEDLRLLSFNIRNGEAEDGSNHWRERHSLTIDIIRSAAADVIGLQEVFDFQLREIADSLPDYAQVGVGREDGAREGEYAPIFYRKAKFDQLATQTIWLSETPDIPGSRSWDSVCTRICTTIRLQYKNGYSFDVYNVHLDHASEPARANGIGVVLDRPSGTPSVLMGDFNANPDEAAIQLVIEKGFIDTWVQAHPNLPYAGTFHGFDPVNSLRDRIDYIFVSPEFTIREATILKDHKDGRYPSDHFPVGARVSFSNES